MNEIENLLGAALGFGREVVDAIGPWLRLLLGIDLDDKQLNAGQMALRAVVVYVVTVLMVRLGKKRFMGRATAFDVILGIMLGSVVSRAITGNTPFLPALAAAAVLVALHSLFSWVALHWHGLGGMVKGHAQVVIRDGKPDWRRLRKSHMSERDLWEDLRTKGIARLDEVAEAQLERSGNLSVIKAKREPKILDVRVAEGVQTVRIELG
jgi:uncharacterized membrane protein YcaP (DUF421 family)